jgi:hypothetical protein
MEWRIIHLDSVLKPNLDIARGAMRAGLRNSAFACTRSRVNRPTPISHTNGTASTRDILSNRPTKGRHATGLRHTEETSSVHSCSLEETTGLFQVPDASRSRLSKYTLVIHAPVAQLLRATTFG